MMKKISDIPDTNPFRVPDNYFEGVKRKIISETAEKNTEARMPGVYKRLRPAFAIAASVAILTLLTFTGIKTFHPGSRTLKISEITTEAISEMVINDIDLVSLEESVDLTDLLPIRSDVNETDIVDYLILENVDLNEIYEFL